MDALCVRRNIAAGFYGNRGAGGTVLMWMTGIKGYLSGAFTKIIPSRLERVLNRVKFSHVMLKLIEIFYYSQN